VKGTATRSAYADFKRLERRMKRLLEEFHHSREIFRRNLSQRDEALRRRQAIIDSINDLENQSQRQQAQWLARRYPRTTERASLPLHQP